MDSLIPVVNKLQDIFNTIGSGVIQLPQIVVVGSQSAGKSSVIETLIGRSILPRGTGIVTRCPLVIQLIYCPMDSLDYRTERTKDVEEWVEFLHDKDSIYTDMDRVREIIEERTSAIAGENKGISREPISLKFFSPSLLNLTLVDLPGITKVPVGDQPENIETQIHELINEYISNPNSIILAISAANMDIATSESLKFAKSVDPDGVRTLAVITKLDLMDAGTDAVDMLCGRVIPVKLGIIGVVNRSQKDIMDNKSIQNAVKDEASFLQRKYFKLASRNGSPYLGKTLNRLLMHHIKSCLPAIKCRISDMATHYRSCIESYGQDILDQSGTLLQIITRFTNAYISALDGTSHKLLTSELCGGARICFIFHESFGKTMDSLEPLSGISYMNIITAIRNATGTKPRSIFVPQIAFEHVVKQQMNQLKEPSLRCVDLVHEEMQRVISNCNQELNQEIHRFPHLHEKIVDVLSKLLNSRIAPTIQMINNILEIEMAYINTNHPDFVGEEGVSDLFLSVLSPGDKASSPEPEKKKNTKAALPVVNGAVSVSMMPESLRNNKDITVKEKQCCHALMQLVRSYFSITRQRIKDSVPKAIMHFLVNYVKENLQGMLVHSLYKQNDFDELLSESADIVLKRKDALNMLAVLDTALDVIGEIREITIW